MAKRLRAHLGIGTQNGGDAHKQALALRSVLLSVLDQFQDVTPEITLAALEPTFALSQVYVPEQTGRLKRSGYLEIVSFRNNPRVEIGYGLHGDPPYTAEVHEMTDVPHTSPHRSKFLQAAVMEDLGSIYTRLGLGYSQFMNGGGSGTGGSDGE